MRALEFFSGLGGWRLALGGRGTVAAAFDISPLANAAYEQAFGERPRARELATIRANDLPDADTWLLSPPCQPFCRMGNRQGLADRRCQAFLRLMDLLREAPPERLALENVVGFRGSDAFDLLVERLEGAGLAWRAWELCPTQFGLPNQRPRVFVAAARAGLTPGEPPALDPAPLAPFLDAEPDPSLFLAPEVLAKHRPGLDLVRAEGHRTACFIGGYGQRFVGSGSFLVGEAGVRRFSPEEIARLLGLPDAFGFPPGLSREARYRLLGNGLSLPVARWVIERLL